MWIYCLFDIYNGLLVRLYELTVFLQYFFTKM
jgi:hypothetical protein